MGKPLLVPTVVFDHPHGYEGYLYGGRTFENICQATCRDLLAHSLVKMERDELRPCLHVHDAPICETGRLVDMATIMSTPPTWAEGFPVLVEGYHGPYWTKRPVGFESIKALNGRIIKHEQAVRR